MTADALAAAAELARVPVTGAVLPAVDQFTTKLDYEFTPSFFHGRFWLRIAREFGMTKTRSKDKGCGRGHLLFFRMRGIYRRTRDFARPELRATVPVAQLETRRREAQLFCIYFASVQKD